jgi:hypothetical protein
MTGPVTASTTRVTSPNPVRLAGVNPGSQASQTTSPNAIANREILAMDGPLRQQLGAGYQSGNTAVSQSGKQGKAVFEMLAANHAQISAVAAKAQAGDAAAQQFIAAFNARLSRLGQALDSTTWYTGATKPSAVLTRMFAACGSTSPTTVIAPGGATGAGLNDQLPGSQPPNAGIGATDNAAGDQTNAGGEPFTNAVVLLAQAAGSLGIPETSRWMQSLKAVKTPVELNSMLKDDSNLEGLTEEQRTKVIAIRAEFNQALQNEGAPGPGGQQ